MSLQEELARLGLDLPADRLPESTPTDAEAIIDVIRKLLAAAFWNRKSFEVEDAFDVYTFLDNQVFQLGQRLAEKGVRAITTNDRLPGLRERDTFTFAGGPPQRGPCHHIRIRADVDGDRLHCRDCGKGINASELRLDVAPRRGMAPAHEDRAQEARRGDRRAQEGAREPEGGDPPPQEAVTGSGGLTPQI